MEWNEGVRRQIESVLEVIEAGDWETEMELNGALWKERGEEADGFDWVAKAKEWEVSAELELPSELEQIVLLPPLATSSLPFSTLFNRIIHNASSSHHTLQLPSNNPLVLPPSSAFLLSDFTSWTLPNCPIHQFATSLSSPGWDLIFLDPPWPNASVARSDKYAQFDPFSLGFLNMFGWLPPKKPCLIAVWVTNRPKFRRLIKEKLFPSWGVKSENVKEWYWVKEAQDGRPVWDLEGEGRRCYEGLLVGTYTPSGTTAPDLPNSKVFLSTPVGHSRKPVILELLKPYLPPSPNVLELFARMTLAGVDGEGTWLSVGNESVKYNRVGEGVVVAS